MFYILNQVNDDQRYKSGDPSAITRDALIVLPFYCKYARKKLLSTRFKPSTKTIHASEGWFTIECTWKNTSLRLPNRTISLGKTG